ncbi:hypothetical protein AKUA1202_06140 [Apilactobacillus kunkeei]|uniref:Putative Zn-dependent peptidase n=1 Tax=Apilactobacillus kunkeei EFB6 TaxID=1419324 RepID=A0A836YWZ5_9LACO|nr:putative Zn-dependent peptidase [Apilactobacillus kunkeei EFB6]CAI2584738.1 hypothetical protein AKUH3B204M_05320 [Apilactobacillus kunkeei]CAI2584890.1 hypothetical protein AKUA1401_05310 [Apilactobacillus kunkeei]CAI2585068.1 hypothetical protein AKUH3B209X_05230 [Apilactobacillus kunkeei]CAI2585290.1 hypothetical protein AKUH4B206J_05300 [Apilactobacillus kunkeei]
MLHKKLANGVDLNVILEDKFKTISFTFDLVSEAIPENFAKRAVLAELMEISNQDYPTQSKLARYLSSMYGASFGTNVLRYGNLSVLRINLSIPNPKFVDAKDDLLQQAVSFIYSVVFKPLATDGQFDKDTFTLQRNNMKKYVESVADDKQYYASIQLKKLFYKDYLNRGSFIFGTPNDYDLIDSQNEYEYYSNVLNNDNIKISVIGDVDGERISNLFDQFKLSDRSVEYELAPLTSFKMNDDVEMVDKKIQSSQSCLNLGYRLPIFYNNKEAMAAVLFNAIFGGTPQSKLFKNVREKNSLAYSASSSYNSINGFVMVSTGINYSNKDKVLAIVKEQLNDIAKGNVDIDVLNSIKAEMINAKKAVLDSPRQNMEQQFVNGLLSRDLSFDEWKQRVNDVTSNQIAEVAKKVELNSIFFLDGRIDDAN